MTRLFTLALSLLLTLPLLSSCMDSGADTPSGPFALKGFVIADEPVVGATVSLVDPHGNVIANTASRPGGVFVITVDRVPADSTITATNGTYRNAEFRGSLKAQVPAGFNPRSRVVYVTPVTTLASTYASSHSSESAADVEVKVRNFLSLPVHGPIANQKRHKPEIFSGGVFMAAGAAYQTGSAAGFDAFVANLAARMALGESQRFVGGDLPMAAAEAAETAGATALLKWALTQLAGGAVASEGGKLFSNLLGLVGLGSPDLTEVQGKLNQISGQISALSDQLTTLGGVLGCQITTGNYDVLLGAGAQDQFDHVEGIQQSMDLYTVLASTGQGTSTEAINTLADLNATIASNLTIHTDVYRHIVGSTVLDSNGAVRALGAKLVACGNFFNATKSTAAANQYSYLASIMAGACQAIVAYRNARSELSEATAAAASCNNTYIPDVLALATPNAIPEGSSDVIDVRYNILWRTLGLRGAEDFLPSGVILGDTYIADLRADLATAANASGQVWYVPALGDVGEFITPCYTDPRGLSQCLSANGWGTYNSTTKTYTSFYGEGAMFFWNRGARIASNQDTNNQYADAALAYNGHSGSVDCFCYAQAMLMRPLDATEVYWLK